MLPGIDLLELFIPLYSFKTPIVIFTVSDRDLFASFSITLTEIHVKLQFGSDSISAIPVYTSKNLYTYDKMKHIYA